MQNNCSCFSNILKVIDVLQRNSFSLDDASCDRPFLGNITSFLNYNTRPVTFYTSNGEIFTVTLTTGETSSIFRVEKVEGNSVVLRILLPSEEPTDISPYTLSNEFVTINLGCICVLQCLPDVLVENL